MNDKMFKYHIATILSSLYDWIALSNEGEAERERKKNNKGALLMFQIYQQEKSTKQDFGDQAACFKNMILHNVFESRLHKHK